MRAGIGIVVAWVMAGAALGEPAPSAPTGPVLDAALAALVASYPAALMRSDGTELVWRDGTRMQTGTSHPKSFESWLEAPGIADMFAQPYPAQAPLTPPALNMDPGRARPAALFEKLYGDCRAGEVTAQLVDVVWLPHKSGRTIKFSGRHGAADRLRAVSARLDALPSRFDGFLMPLAGTYVCRVIAGTQRTSAHGYGIAIDLAVKRSHYWRWALGGERAYRNETPPEIVAAFEAEGFIWGGRWSHFDTMHFEYRPELIGLRSGRD